MFQNLRRLAERFTVPDDELPPGNNMDYNASREAADTKKKEKRLTIGKSTYIVDKELLGDGTYGSVFKVHSIESKSTSIFRNIFDFAFRAKRNYVMKETKEPQNVGHNASFIREINALQNLRDVPNIIQIYDFGYEYNKGIVIMEAGTTSLRTLLTDHAISNSLLSNRKSIMYKIVSAMRALTLRGFWHRDLKPQNIVMMTKNDDPKIIDFGLCRMGPHEDIQGTNKVYTVWYRPPELLLRSQHVAHLYDGDKCDVWGVAMVFLDILTLGRRTLFTTLLRSDKKETDVAFIAGQMKKIYGSKNLEYVNVESDHPLKPPAEKLWIDSWKGKLTPVLESYLQPYDKSERKDLIDLLLKMMAPHPTNRASYDDVLQHNYFKTETPIPTPTLPQMQGDYKIVSTDVNIRMYTILADWLYEVCFKYKLRIVTYIQGMALIRKVLSVYAVVKRHDLQLIGCVCMQLSSMLYDVSSPIARQWKYISDHSFSLEKFHETLFTIFRDVLKGNLRVFSAYDVLRTRCSTLAQLNGILRLVALCDMIGLHYYLQSQEMVVSIAEKIKRIIEEEQVFKNIELKEPRMEKLEKVVFRVFEDEKEEFKGLKTWWKGTKENTKDFEEMNKRLKTFSQLLRLDWIVEQLEQKIVCTTEEKSNDDQKCDGKQVPGNDMSAVRGSPSNYTTLDDLKREFPQIWDIDDAIVEGNNVEEPDLKLWKRAFMLSWTNDMKEPVESVKNDIHEKLIETCEVERGVIQDWMAMETDDYTELFNELYNKVSLDKLACVGL